MSDFEVTAAEACAALGVSLRQLRRWTAARVLAVRVHPVSGVLVYSKAGVEALADQRQAAFAVDQADKVSRAQQRKAWNRALTALKGNHQQEFQRLYQMELLNEQVAQGEVGLSPVPPTGDNHPAHI